jgi:MFS transporter, SP family, sugar:H+ symporter
MLISSTSGVILQVSATSAAQFTIGRVVTYGMTGMAIVVVPIYQAETAPKVLRGMFGSTIQLMIVFGQLIATLVTFSTQHIRGSRGWHIPIGLQLIMPALIITLLPLLPESPRWLLSRGRRDDAVSSLGRLRKVEADELETEMETIAYAHAASGGQGRATWAEVFNARNRRRTAVAVLAMFGQQIAGQAFPSQYGVIFYQSQGFANQAFLFNVLSAVVGLVAVVITWFYVDAVGRRPVLLIGGSMMGAFLFILGAMGAIGRTHLNGAEKNLTVASLMMFSFSFNLSWAPV